jgi:uncharacterized membrane protein YbaN (DUF454 family)
MNGGRPTKRTLRRAMLIAGGSVCLGLGIVGVFLPLLPTTPFLLLAAACYVRSSRRIYDWLLNVRWLGSYVRSYRERRGVPLRVKTLAISLLWITIGYSVVSVVHLLLLRIILLAVAAAVTMHILSIPTLKS